MLFKFISHSKNSLKVTKNYLIILLIAESIFYKTPCITYGLEINLSKDKEPENTTILCSFGGK